MSSVSSSSPSSAKPSRWFGSIRALRRHSLNRCVLGLFVVAWLLGSAGGKPCCCQTAQAASTSLPKATEVSSDAQATLPPCCVQHSIAASHIETSDHGTQPCADGLQSLAAED